MPYNNIAGVDDTHAFPPEVRAKLAQADELMTTFAQLGQPFSWRASWARRAFEPPSFADRPEIAVAATSTSVFGTSKVTYKPAVIGIGSSTTNWDGASDTNIRYGGGPGTTTKFNTGNGGSGDLGLYAAQKPGGGAQAASWPFIYEFATVSAQIEIYTYHQQGDSFMVEVNGHLVADASITQATFAAGNGRINLTFPTDGYNGQQRRIRIFAASTHGLSEIRVPTGYTISKPSARQKTIAIIGDSWINGAGGFGNLDGFGPRLMRMIDPTADYIYAGIGGTGWTAGMDGGSSNAYSTRIASVLASNPDVLLFYGSQNDGNTDVSAAVTAALTTAATVPKIVVIPTLLRGYPVQAASIKAAVTAKGRTYVDVAGSIDGAGYVASITELAGNTSLFVNASNDLHMNLDGNRTVADFIFARFPDTAAA